MTEDKKFNDPIQGFIVASRKEHSGAVQTMMSDMQTAFNRYQLAMGVPQATANSDMTVGAKGRLTAKQVNEIGPIVDQIESLLNQLALMVTDNSVDPGAIGCRTAGEVWDQFRSRSGR